MRDSLNPCKFSYREERGFNSQGCWFSPTYSPANRCWPTPLCRSPKIPHNLPQWEICPLVSKWHAQKVDKQMSLFENDEYQWRETYFVLFSADRLPSAHTVEQSLRGLNSNYELLEVRESEAGGFESLTLLSPDDYAAMDLSCVTGEEVREQVAELAEQLRATASSEELEVIDKIPQCTARLEVYHFEQLVFIGSSGDTDEPDDFMDPGSLLVVLEKIAELCDGIVVDPQANSLL